MNDEVTAGQNIQDMTDERLREVTLRDILAPLFRQRRIAFLTLLGTLLSGISLILVSPNKYRGQMQILVKRERVDPVVTSEASPQTIQSANPVTEQEINSEVALLLTDDLLREVVRETGLNELKHASILGSIFPAESPEARTAKAVRQLAKQIDVSALKNTNMIDVTYQTTDPNLAFRVLSALATRYLEKHLAVHRPPGAFGFFQQETEEYRKGLENAENRLAEFGSKNEVASAGMETELTQKKLSDFDEALRESQAQVIETRHRIENLESQLKTTPMRIDTARKAADNAQLLEVLGGTLATLQLRRSEMAAHYAPDYRPLKDLDEQISRARAQMEAASAEPVREETTDVNPAYLWLTEELTKSEADLATYEAKASATSRNVQLYREEAVEFGRKQLEQDDLLRNAKAEERNFLLYLDKREESRIADAMDSKRILNVAIAQPPTVPALPENSPLRSILIVVILSAMLSVAAAYIMDYIDPTLRTADETGNLLEIPILAAMPKPKRGQSSVVA